MIKNSTTNKIGNRTEVIQYDDINDENTILFYYWKCQLYGIKSAMKKKKKKMEKVLRDHSHLECEQ